MNILEVKMLAAGGEIAGYGQGFCMVVLDAKIANLHKLPYELMISKNTNLSYYCQWVGDESRMYKQYKGHHYYIVISPEYCCYFRGQRYRYPYDVTTYIDYLLLEGS